MLAHIGTQDFAAYSICEKATFNSLPTGKFFMLLCGLLIFFKSTLKESYRLDPDQAPCFVRPDMGPNCLQKLSAGDTWR